MPRSVLTGQLQKTKTTYFLYRAGRGGGHLRLSSRQLDIWTRESRCVFGRSVTDYTLNSPLLALRREIRVSRVFYLPVASRWPSRIRLCDVGAKVYMKLIGWLYCFLTALRMRKRRAQRVWKYWWKDVGVARESLGLSVRLYNKTATLFLRLLHSHPRPRVRANNTYMQGANNGAGFCKNMSTENARRCIS